MAFSSRRGRPPRPPSDAPDCGTPELRFKHAHGLTTEPLDLCLAHGIITPQQHRSGLHLRWLHAVRYGAPKLTTRYDHAPDAPPRPDDPAWRRLREEEFHIALTLLRHGRHDRPVMQLCIYHEWPEGLHPAACRHTSGDLNAAARLAARRLHLSEGLELLVAHWKPRHCVEKALADEKS